MKKLALSVLSIMILAFAFNVQAEESAGWQIDKAHSNIGFSVRHLGISKVKGKFQDYTASIEADSATGKLTKFVGTVQATSIDTGIDARDNHLRSADFFDAKKYPTLTLKSKSIKFNGDKVTITADLTMKDITQTITMEGEFLGSHVVDFGNGKTRRAGYSFSAKVNRKDYGLSYNNLAESVAVVSDEVTILIETEIFLPVK